MNIRLNLLRIFGTISLALFVSACASQQARINQFDQFALAGKSYTASVEALLDASLVAAIEADNQVLITARELNSDKGFLSGKLEETDEASEERAAILQRIKKQLRLLEGYFVAIGILASDEEGGAVSDATTGLAGSAKTLAERLATLSSSIAGAQIGGKSVPDVVESVVPVAVAFYRRKALDDALQATADPVAKSLAIHRAAIETIRDQMEADLSLGAEQERTETIANPYTDSGNLPSDWGQRRVAWLTRQAQIMQLDEAVSAAEKLEIAFYALLEGQSGGPSFALLLADLHELTNVIEQLKQ